MRAILDAHPDIRCGEETRVIPRILGLKSQWLKSDRESKRLIEAGLTEEVLSSALAAFILEVGSYSILTLSYDTFIYLFYLNSSFHHAMMSRGK